MAVRRARASSPRPTTVLRLGKAGSPVLARLEIRDPDWPPPIDDLSLPVDRSGRSERRMRSKVVVWSLAATASLVLVAVVVRATHRDAAHAADSLLGRAQARRSRSKAQVRASLDTGHGGAAFECGNAAQENRRPRSEFDKLIAVRSRRPPACRYRSKSKSCAGQKPMPSRCPAATSMSSRASSTEAEEPDELAGVIAHEVGHVAHRDGTRSVLQAAGLSLLFGMLLGDFVGGGAVVFAAKTILQTSYTRDVETAADAYGVTLMTKIGGDPRALGTFLVAHRGNHASRTEDPARSSGDQRPRCGDRSAWRGSRRRGRC